MEVIESDKQGIDEDTIQGDGIVVPTYDHVPVIKGTSIEEMSEKKHKNVKKNKKKKAKTSSITKAKRSKKKGIVIPE